eukprot:235844_1
MTCDFNSLTVSAIQIFIFLLGTVFIIGLSYCFVRSNDEKYANRCIHYTTVCFCGMIILAFFMYTMENVVHCIDEDVGVILGFIGDGGWVIHYILFVWLLFFRLDHILQASLFKISWISKSLFYVLFILSIFANNFVFIMESIGLDFIPYIISEILGIIGFFSVLLLIIGFIILFIYKLIEVTKKADDETLIFNMIKSFFLAVTFAICGVLVIIILMSTIAITENTNSEYVQLIYSTVTEINVIINCCCILFGFNMFEKYYLTVCGKCQTKCVNWCSEKRENSDKRNTERTDLSTVHEQINV